MADRVVRIRDVFNVEHDTSGQHVVLKVTGSAGTKRVRVEINLENWIISYVAKSCAQEPIINLTHGSAHVIRWGAQDERLDRR